MARFQPSPQNLATMVDRESFEQLKREVQRLRISLYQPQNQYRHVRTPSPISAPPGLLQAITPPPGIPGYGISSGAITYASALCRRIVWDSANNAGTIGEEITIYNPVATAIAGETLISAMPSWDDPTKLFAVVESCEDTTQETYLDASAGEVIESESIVWEPIEYNWTILDQSPAGSFQTANGGRSIQYLGSDSLQCSVDWAGLLTATRNNRVVEVRMIKDPPGTTTLPVSISLASSGLGVNYRLQSTLFTMDQNDVFSFQFQEVSGSGPSDYIFTDSRCRITAFST